MLSHFTPTENKQRKFLTFPLFNFNNLSIFVNGCYHFRQPETKEKHQNHFRLEIIEWRVKKMLQIGVNFKSINNTGFITNDKALKQIL